ncbi:hypothetical protein BDY24DRAFT_417917 [Mrakia frigida]|uniref:uncharacterized protein n=1 Tax=Mrakia frigida TaxID=29902 RepID=UPI003FCBF4CD
MRFKLRKGRIFKLVLAFSVTIIVWKEGRKRFGSGRKGASLTDERGVKYEVDTGGADYEEKESEHVWSLDDGVLLVDLDGIIHHPIFELIQNAEAQWNETLEGIPMTKAAFESEYLAQNLRIPPPHLSNLFNPLSPNPSALLSPAPFYPYLSIHPSVLRARQRLAEATPSEDEAFVLVVEEGRVRVEYPWVTGGKVEEMGRAIVGLLEGWEDLLDLRLTFTLSSLETPHLIPRDLLVDAFDLAAAGEMQSLEYTFALDPDVPPKWSIACLPKASLRKEKFAEEILIESLEARRPKPPALIFFPYSALDPCKFPALVDLSPVLSLPPPPPDLQPVPRIASTRTALGSEVLVPLPSLGGGKLKSSSRGRMTRWSDMGGISAHWRGKPPPLLHPLNETTLLPQPYRLLLLPVTPLPSYFSNLIYPDSDTNDENDSYGYRIAMRIGGRNGNVVWKNEKFLDVAFEEEVECGGREGCEELKEKLPVEEKIRTVAGSFVPKFVLVLDGESPEEAFLDGSLVLYASLVLHSWMEHAVPWKHYVPLQPNFSDLPSILLFFRRYDEEAKRIAEAGRRFAQTMMSEDADRTALVGMLLEWGRILNEEPRREMDKALEQRKKGDSRGGGRR